MFRANPYKYRIPDEPDEICLRVVPPRTLVIKRMGVLAAKVYEHVDVGDFQGRLRTNYPKAGPARAVLSAAMPSGRLVDVAHVFFEGADDDMRIVAVELFEALKSNRDVVAKITRATGTKAKAAGKRGADAMAS